MSSNPKVGPVKQLTEYWDERRNIIRTRNGGWRVGSGIFCHEYSMMDDLVGKTSYFQTMVLNITGKLPDKKLADFLEAAFICMSWPDTRLWCNQIGALGGTLRAHPVAAICAGILASDSRMYGPGTASDALDFIYYAMRKHQSGVSCEAIINNYCKNEKMPSIPGYGRPIAYGDERVTALERVMRELDIEKGAHLSLAYNLQKVLFDREGESMNLAGFLAGFLPDQGLAKVEIMRLTALMVNSGVAACYSEAFDNAPESLLPLRCDDIDYRGKPHRTLPE